MPTKIDRIASDVKHLKKWTELHQERHGDDADMLGRVLDNMETHTSNHHSRTTEIKRGASIITILAIFAAVVEVARQFVI